MYKYKLLADVFLFPIGMDDILPNKRPYIPQIRKVIYVL